MRVLDTDGRVHHVVNVGAAVRRVGEPLSWPDIRMILPSFKYGLRLKLGGFGRTLRFNLTRAVSHRTRSRFAIQSRAKHGEPIWGIFPVGRRDLLPPRTLRYRCRAMRHGRVGSAVGVSEISTACAAAAG